MDEIFNGSVLQSEWIGQWRLFPLLVFIVIGLIYRRGSTTRPDISPSFSQQLRFYGGIFLTSMILVSPLYYLSTQYFSIHVIQHMWLAALIPSLLMSSSPNLALWQGLPEQVRNRLRFMASRLTVGQAAVVRQLLSPGMVFIMALVTIGVWYDPTIHQLALRHRWLHAVETTLVLGIGCLYWWHITAVYPFLHTHSLSPIVRIIYAFLGTWPVKMVGLILLFSAEDLYQYPRDYRFSGLDITDQDIGAIIAWVLGGLVFLFTAAKLIHEWLGEEAEKPPHPEPAWLNADKMRAPGFPK